MSTGIYQIRNTVNGRFYVGSTMSSFGQRWSEHKSLLRSGKHRNHPLQQDWDQYGGDAFEFSVLETLPEDKVLSREQELISRLFDDGAMCYNLADRAIAGGGRKYIYPPELKRSKIILAKKQVNVDFSRHPELFDAMRRLAAEMDMDFSKLVRQAVREYVSAHESSQRKQPTR